MSPVELHEHLSGLDPDHLERLMHVLVKQHVERDPDAAAYFESEVMLASLRAVATDAGLMTDEIAEPIDKASALRAIALELAEEAGQATLLTNALAVVDRPTRVDPITASLVLAGIVLVLQTRFEVSYGNEDGKKKLHIAIRKAPTSEKLLARLFGLFKAAPRS